MNYFPRDFRALIRRPLDAAGFLGGFAFDMLGSPRNCAKSSGGSGSSKSSETITDPRYIPSGRTTSGFLRVVLRVINYVSNLAGG
jgi:hypothetical protein